jgi:hypothetical protein
LCPGNENPLLTACNVAEGRKMVDLVMQTYSRFLGIFDVHTWVIFSSYTASFKL